ncbi:ubiquitin carboxyl-terminal hydrolase 48 isoform 2-T3 [Spinachia spinachia]
MPGEDLRQDQPKGLEAFQRRAEGRDRMLQRSHHQRRARPILVPPTVAGGYHRLALQRGELAPPRPRRPFLPDAVHCGVCGEETRATCASKMAAYPQILCLLVKRFIFDNDTRSHSKSDCRVDVPRWLQRDHKNYEVYAMVNHTGSLRGGHYTASARGHEDATWYEFDDANVYKIEEQPFAESGIYSSSTAYLLMYREAAKHDRLVLNPEKATIQIPDSEQTVEDDKGSRAKCPTCKTTPLWISLIVVVCVLVLVLVVALPIVYA